MIDILVLTSPRTPGEFWARAKYDGAELLYRVSERLGGEKIIRLGSGGLHDCAFINGLFAMLECMRFAEDMEELAGKCLPDHEISFEHRTC